MREKPKETVTKTLEQRVRQLEEEVLKFEVLTGTETRLNQWESLLKRVTQCENDVTGLVVVMQLKTIQIQDLSRLLEKHADMTSEDLKDTLKAVQGFLNEHQQILTKNVGKLIQKVLVEARTEELLADLEKKNKLVKH